MIACSATAAAPQAQQPRPAPAHKRIAILQSNYIPWKGYFDLINSVDEFILYDDMQYTRRDWRNRNRIKTPHGPLWLTIPVHVKGRFHQRIRDAEVSDPTWAARHWRSLVHAYSRAPFWHRYRDGLEALYLDCRETHLSAVNRRFLNALCDWLNIRTPIRDSSEYRLIDGKTERLVDICRQAGATHYLSGPAAKDYVVPELFSRAGIELEWMDYSGYPEYAQLYPPFDHHVSVLDLILCTGPGARHYLGRVRAGDRAIDASRGHQLLHAAP